MLPALCAQISLNFYKTFISITKRNISIQIYTIIYKLLERKLFLLCFAFQIKVCQLTEILFFF